MGECLRDIFPARLLMLVREFETQKTFADHIGVSQLSVIDWAKRKRPLPRLSEFALIADRCHVSADWLLGLSEDPGRVLLDRREDVGVSL